MGAAPETDVVSLRVFFGEEGAGGDVIAAIVVAADRGCDAANLSLGIPASTIGELPDEVVEEYVTLYTAAVQYARSRDMVVVNSSGNSGLDLDGEGNFTTPTEIDGVFGVSATGPIGFLWGDGPNMAHNALSPGQLEEPPTDPAFYTNYGESAIDISAAGGDLDQASADPDAAFDLVLSTVNTVTDDGEVEAGYGWKAATSMAAPQVSGAVALVRSLQPDASVNEVKDLFVTPRFNRTPDQSTTVRAISISTQSSRQPTTVGSTVRYRRSSERGRRSTFRFFGARGSCVS